MAAAERTFLVEMTITKTLRVLVGGPNGSIPLKKESAEAAAEAIALDYFHLSEALLPSYVAIEELESNVESRARGDRGVKDQ